LLETGVLQGPLEFPHNYFRLPPLQDLGGTKWRRNTTILLEDAVEDESKLMQFSWVDLSDYTPGPSLGAAFCWHNVSFSYDNNGPSWDGTSSVGNDLQDVLNGTALFTCSIDARWAPVRMLVDPRSDDFAHQDPSSVLGILDSGNFRNLQQIHIDVS